mmetsp:Transcript_4112/g.11732  ORF Transcript_4112/g.11732 Transcript_4112/m.11732 type:complete len:360 (-) Transcript_4112:341-1420(-)
MGERMERILTVHLRDRVDEVFHLADHGRAQFDGAGILLVRNGLARELDYLLDFIQDRSLLLWKVRFCGFGLLVSSLRVGIQRVHLGGIAHRHDPLQHRLEHIGIPLHLQLAVQEHLLVRFGVVERIPDGSTQQALHLARSTSRGMAAAAIINVGTIRRIDQLVGNADLGWRRSHIVGAVRSRSIHHFIAMQVMLDTLWYGAFVAVGPLDDPVGLELPLSLRPDPVLAWDDPRFLADSNQCIGRFLADLDLVGDAQRLDSGSRVHRIAEQLEAGFFAAKNSCSDWTGMQPKSHGEISGVRAKRDRQLSHNDPELCNAHLGKSGHDDGMLIGWFRQSRAGDVAVPNSFHLEDFQLLCELVE